MTDLRDGPAHGDAEPLVDDRPRVVVKRRWRKPDITDRPWEDDPWDRPLRGLAPVVERPRRRHRSAAAVAYLALALGIVAVLVAGSVGWWYIHKINPEGDPGEAVNFTVTDTDTLETISERLEEQGLVSDAGVFRWYVERQGGLDLTPGYYQIRPSDHMGNVMQVLRTPPEQTFKQVTFPEGFTITKMANRLAEVMPRLLVAEYIRRATDGTISSSYLEFAPPGTTSLEGLLFPDTYQVSNGESVDDVIQRQVDLMERVGRQEQIVEKGYALGQDAYSVLTIASMIEREAQVEEDRAMIARVILNRLELGMPLQIDATLFYGQDPDLSVSQLKLIDTPYNTYLHAGLPPTPIANPGRASIAAAVNPAADPPEGGKECQDLPKSECHWLYYVLSPKGDGSHVFAVTLEQHEANVEAAREAGVL